MKVAYLSGGIGGARLLDGLARVLPSGALTAIVNVGDDFDHWGLRVCPDLDTVLYTLSGFGDPKRGWGLRKETFRTLEWVQRYGGEDWFALGDADLAAHLMRTRWLRQGVTLTEVTERLGRALELDRTILPASNERFETQIETLHEGTLSFQDWLVRRRGEPMVGRVWFQGDARPTPQVLEALEQAELILIGPSNPYVSIDPILALPGVRERLEGRPVIAVSPIVAGQAIKGPLTAMIESLAERRASAAAVAAHYAGLLRGFVVQQGDQDEIQNLPCLATQTVMRTRPHRLQLARAVLAFSEKLCS